MGNEKRVIKGDGEVQDENSPIGRPASLSAGTLPMDVEGPFGDERYRLTYGMTDADRALRKQWLKDQMLAENEPVMIPGMYQAKHNPIYRAMNYPMNTLAEKAVPYIGENPAWFIRGWCKGLMFITGAVWFTSYYFRYSAQDWTMGKVGWRVYRSKNRLLPGDPGYSEEDVRHRSDFGDMGFKAADPAITGYNGAHGTKGV